jgi:hypothetical protein
MLGLFVIAPRVALAAGAALRGAYRARHLALPEDAYFARLLRELQGRTAHVQVLPQGAAPSPQATLALQAWLATACGEGMTLQMAPATPYGQEEEAEHLATLAPPAGTTLRVLLVDLGSTPEPDTHGRLLQALQAQAGAQGSAGVQQLVLADEAGFRRRFGQLPERLAQRRQAWRALAAAQGAGFIGLDLEHADSATAEAALQAAWLPGATAAPDAAEAALQAIPAAAAPPTLLPPPPR